MSIEILLGKVPIHLWTQQVDVEKQALAQLYGLAALPWVFHHVAVMPDCHFGKGATVGSVVAMKNAVSPAACGVDVGCGMGAVRTSLRASDLPNSLDALRSDIEKAIPVGFNAHQNAAFNKRESLKRFGADLFGEFKDLTEKVQGLESRAMNQVGTLGGGNHFIEVCLDDGRVPCDDCGGNNGGCIECVDTAIVEPRVWLMLHSGSRNIGKELADYHINVARRLAHNQFLPDRDLAVFLSGTPEMDSYRHDLFWGQRYAMFNRKVMFELLGQAMALHFPEIDYDEPILCHHNYISEETHFGENVIVTRKGAISARNGEMGIIPGSMSSHSYVVEGLGNEESFHSASHGAGRRMSRGEAKRTFTVEDLERRMEGICARKDAGVLDEIEDSYKNIDQVMENQKDLVKVVAKLKQVLVVKG